MKLKIGLVGSSGCGKTFLANILGSEGGAGEGVKPPYRPTNSVRIVEFTIPSLQLNKYTLDVDIQLWEVGGSPSVKSIYPGVHWGLDGVIVMYDVSKEFQIREASAFYMNFVTHSPSNLPPSHCLLIGNKFRGSADSGPQRVIGIPPRSHHIAVNIEDDPQRLREEVKILISRIAQYTIDQEKANIITPGGDSAEKFMSRKLTASEFRLFQEESCPMKEKSRSKRPPTRGRAIINIDPNIF